MRTLINAIIVLVIATATGISQDSRRLERLETLGDIWGQVYAFHPKLMAEDIDWRGAFLSAISKVQAAQSTEAYVAVINEMLSKVGDPLTAAQITPPLVQPGPEPSARLIAPGIGYLDLTEARHVLAKDFTARPRALVDKLGPINRLVVDLRWRSIAPAVPVQEDDRDKWLGMFYTHPVRTRGWVRRVHEGWQEEGRDDSYGQHWDIRPGTEFKPDAPLKIKAVFLVNYPAVAVFEEQLDALQSCGHIVVLEQSGVVYGSAYPEHIRFASPGSMIISQAGALGFLPDAVVPRVESLTTIAALEKHPDERQGFSPLSFRFPALEPVKTDLTREERLYGLLKAWFIICRFYPDLEYASAGWPATVRAFIPRVEAAADFREYYRALREWTAPLNDSHVGLIDGPPAPQVFIPARLAYLEDKVIVLKVAPNAGGIQRGDEIIALDGRSVADFEKEWRGRLSSSSLDAFRRNYMFPLVVGPKDSELALTIIRKGEVHVVKVRRTATPRDLAGGGSIGVGRPTPVGESFGILETNIGYIDLNSMPDERKLDEAFHSLSGSRGLILDMRGYPHVGIWELAARLANTPAYGHRYEIPLVLPLGPFDRSHLGRVEASIRYQRRIEPNPVVHYDGPVVMLINEMAQSAAESLALYAKDTGRVTVVGSNSTGTTGGVTHVSLPGGAKLGFTGARAYLADGSRFQNIGVQPDIYVKPTVAGVLAGRDEVLEKGREVLERLIKENKPR